MIRQGIDEDIKKMADSYMMTEDLHTHTLYSKGRFKKHATGTIEENVQAAFERGFGGSKEAMGRKSASGEIPMTSGRMAARSKSSSATMVSSRRFWLRAKSGR